MKRVVIGVHGGLVQWACSDMQPEDLEVVVMDFDIEGECDESRIFGNIAAVHSEFASEMNVLDPEVRLALDEFDREVRLSELKTRLDSVKERAKNES